MLVPMALTPGGWPVPALLPQPDDDVMTLEPCPWCDGEGSAGGGAPQEELDANPALLLNDCQRCNGSGSISITTRGHLRKRAWDEQCWHIDMERAITRDRGCCPLCGRGGGHDEEPCPREPHIEVMLCATTGAEAPMMEV